MKVAIKKISKSMVVGWGSINGKLYPIEYCHLRMLAKAGCSRIANILDGFDLCEEYILVLEAMDDCNSIADHLRYNSAPIKEPRCKLIFRQLVDAVRKHKHNS